ncbi:MAG: hypothetical protein WBC33_08235 [Conexibacter sp.]
MICTLTARRLKPGAYDAFRAAWDPGDAPPEVIARWGQVYHVRDVTDPDVVISFGMFDGTLDELRALQADFPREAQVDRVDPHVQEVLLDGAYEVVEQLSGADFGA